MVAEVWSSLHFEIAVELEGGLFGVRREDFFGGGFGEAGAVASGGVWRVAEIVSIAGALGIEICIKLIFCLKTLQNFD